MSVRILIPTLFAFILAGCHNRQQLQDHRKQETPAPVETPKALDDKTSYSFTKRGEGNLVEELYEELVSKDAALKRLEDQIDELDKSQGDSAHSFFTFNQKNQSYYNIAESNVTEIKDSVLSEKIKLLVAGSLARYKSQISKHYDLLNTINAKKSTIEDLHHAVKIITTLAVMERYQRENLPGTKALKGYMQEEDKAIRLADTLVKR